MFGNGIDGELEGGKGSSSNQFTRNEADYAPANTGRVDPSLLYKTWLESPFDDAIFGKFGSTSRSFNGWNDISCTDLLAMANAGVGGAVAAGQTQPCGQNFLCDLNFPPQTMAETSVNTGLSLRFTPLTPDPAKSTNLAADKDVVETNKDSEKGLCEQTNLNETPQPKQKRRKHRPKVVTEGTPKRTRKPATPKPTTPNPDGSTTGKRKYVRKKGVEKSPTTPGVDEIGGEKGIHPSPDQEIKKTCKRKINFDESENVAEVTVDKTCTATSEVMENDQKVQETGSSPSPITPSKPELPPKSVKRKYTKAQCKINFLQETHDKVPSHFPSPNEPGCSTSVCNNAGMIRDSLESYLSVFTDYTTNMQSYAIDNNKGKAPEMPNRGYNPARGQNSKRKKITTQDMVTFGGYQQHHMLIESNVAGFGFSNINTKKQAMAASFYHNHLGYNHGIYGIDALISHFEQLHINREARYHEKNALVVYQHGGSLVPYNTFNPVKKTKHRPKVDLDDETNRVWMLLLEDINSKGVDGNDEEKEKWWEEERRVFRGRADSFIARMHLVQGDRRFSPWKGSVLDSVVGVFLTQNVSDHLSSSAFMSLAARFPLKKNTRSEEVVNNDEFSKSCVVSVDLNERSDYEVAESFEKITNHVEVLEIASSQNSVEQKDGCEANVGGPGSFVELFSIQESTLVYEKCVSEESGISVESANQSQSQSQTTGQVVNTISSQESATSHCCIAQQDPEKINLSIETSKKDKNVGEVSEESVQKVVDFHSQTMGQMVNTISSQESTTSHCCIAQQDLEKINLSTETSKITKDKNIVEVSEESVQKVVDFHSQTMGQVVNTISSQESATGHCRIAQQDLGKINLSTEGFKASKDKNIVEVSEESVHKVVDFNNNNNKTNGVDEGSSKVKKEKTGKSKSNVDWSKLFEGVVKRERERSPNAMDSMDYEAIRAARISDVAEAIKERGMHYRLAERIKDMLDRLVTDHGSTNLEWLRDIPPDKAKEYLLSFAGLGLKSVECIRLLTLHHLAFPVDTNVGRIAVRLGWVPLQALPESLQLHLLELYPVQETIQKYLWPRLCKLDQKTLYELHYQMITFGKVFCTKTKPNCNACPMRGECRHFASAFASARLALPAPEGSIAGATTNKSGQNPIGMIDLPPSISQQPKQSSEVQNGNVVTEELTAPGPIVEVPTTQGPIVEMPASPEPEQIQQEVFDIEDFNGDDEEEIPMIKLNIEEFTQNLQTYMERHMEIGECDLSKALVALTPEAASIPTPKLKNVNQLRTEHQVYELPDSHPLLEGLDRRETDDPCPYLLAIWTPGETADSIQPPEGQCCSQESGIMCNQETCFFCISTREANAQTIRGTLLIPCRTANRGSFPLNGTYFQVNEVFADHESSINPIDVPRAWLWNLPKRTVYFGTSVPSIFKGLTTEETQICFWRGFVCVRGYDRKERAPRPLRARLHFPASRLKQQPKPKTDPNEMLKL